MKNLKFNRLRAESFENGLGLGFTLLDEHGEPHRQAVVIPTDASSEDVAAALELLAAFLRNPDERMVVGDRRLAGNELNRAGVNVGEAVGWEQRPIPVAFDQSIVVDGIQMSGHALAAIARGGATIRFERVDDSLTLTKL